jgi:hypothetical protein
MTLRMVRSRAFNAWGRGKLERLAKRMVRAALPAKGRSAAPPAGGPVLRRPGGGSHTYSLLNAANERFWVKFHFKTQQGYRHLTNAEGAELVGRTRESHGEDLYNAIKRGNFPRWKMQIQVITEAETDKMPFNPFDLTKVWPHGDYPIQDVATTIVSDARSIRQRRMVSLRLDGPARFRIRGIGRRRGAFPAVVKPVSRRHLCARRAAAPFRQIVALRRF